MNAPCKDCPDREFDCHCKCVKYKIYSEQIAAEKHTKFESEKTEKMLAEYFHRTRRNFCDKQVER